MSRQEHAFPITSHVGKVHTVHCTSLTLLSAKCSLPFSLSDSSSISWSDDDSACDFTDRFEKCGRGRRRVEESAVSEEKKASLEDAAVTSEDENGDEDRNATEKKSEKNKQTQTTSRHAVKVEAAAAAPVKVGDNDTLCCLV